MGEGGRRKGGREGGHTTAECPTPFLLPLLAADTGAIRKQETSAAARRTEAAPFDIETREAPDKV